MGADRRSFIVSAAAGAAGLLMIATHARAEDEESKGAADEEASPAEDLMREHGVHNRVLLVYGEGLRRIAANEDLPPEPLADAVKVVREFIEDYHVKLEEEFLFPRFKKAGRLAELVDVLAKHRVGRCLTVITIRLVTLQGPKNADDRRCFQAVHPDV